MPDPGPPSGGRTWVDVPTGGTVPPGAPDMEASTLNSLESDLSSAFHFKHGELFVVEKDPATGFWPAGWATDGRTPVYSGGAVDQVVRPTSEARRPYCAFVGADPSPPIVTTGTAGMYASDMRWVQ